MNDDQHDHEGDAVTVASQHEEDGPMWASEGERIQAGGGVNPPGLVGDRDLQGLRVWWLTTAAGDIDGSLSKLREYGGDGPAVDLVTTGDFLARACGWNDYSEQDAIELAIAFYLVSKVGRWQAAILNGSRPSDDTLFDITYYAMMARRNRAVGAWPWPAGEGTPC